MSISPASLQTEISSSKNSHQYILQTDAKTLSAQWASTQLNFEEAAKLRDEVKRLELIELSLLEGPGGTGLA